MEDARQAFIRYLQRHNCRVTQQRLLIFQVLFKAGGHLTPEELYDLVKKQDPSVGQATVYRTLKLLTQAKIAREVGFGDSATRFELLYGQQHHDHLICIKCKREVEFVDQRIEKLQEELAKSHGFELTGHEMYLYGVCPECRKK